MSFFKDIKKPFNMVTFILTLVFGIASVIFYFKSKNERSISYYLVDSPSLIYNSDNSSSRITVLENDSIPLVGNVYLLTGTIWNDGDLPIDEEHIRKHLSIDLLDSEKIIDYKILTQTNKEISKFDLIKISKNSLSIKWDYFDPNNGFKFQVIYLGSEDPNFDLSGNILGVKEFKRIKNLKPYEKKDNIEKIIVFSTLVLMPFFGIYIERRKALKNKREFKMDTFLNVVLLISVCAFLIVVYLVYITFFTLDNFIL